MSLSFRLFNQLSLCLKPNTHYGLQHCKYLYFFIAVVIFNMFATCYMDQIGIVVFEEFRCAQSFGYVSNLYRSKMGPVAQNLFYWTSSCASIDYRQIFLLCHIFWPPRPHEKQQRDEYLDHEHERAYKYSYCVNIFFLLLKCMCVSHVLRSRGSKFSKLASCSLLLHFMNIEIRSRFLQPYFLFRFGGRILFNTS